MVHLDLDYKRIASIRKVNYNGYVSIEFEGKSPPDEGVAKSVELLRNSFPDFKVNYLVGVALPQSGHRHRDRSQGGRSVEPDSNHRCSAKHIQTFPQVSISVFVEADLSIIHAGVSLYIPLAVVCR